MIIINKRKIREMNLIFMKTPPIDLITCGEKIR